MKLTSFDRTFSHVTFARSRKRRVLLFPSHLFSTFRAGKTRDEKSVELSEFVTFPNVIYRYSQNHRKAWRVLIQLESKKDSSGLNFSVAAPQNHVFDTRQSAKKFRMERFHDIRVRSCISVGTQPCALKVLALRRPRP